MTAIRPDLALSLTHRYCQSVAGRVNVPSRQPTKWLESCLLARSERILDRLVSPKTATKQPQGSCDHDAFRHGVGNKRPSSDEDGAAESESTAPGRTNIGTPAALTAEATPSHKENDHSCRTDNGGLAGRPHTPTHSTVRDLVSAPSGRDGFAVCAGRSRTPASRPPLACAVPGTSGGRVVRVPLEPARGRRRLARLVPVLAVDVGAHPVRGKVDLRSVRQCVGGGVASEKGRWLV